MKPLSVWRLPHFLQTLQRLYSCSGHEQHQSKRGNYQQQQPDPALTPLASVTRVARESGWSATCRKAAGLANQSTCQGPVRSEPGAPAALTHRDGQLCNALIYSMPRSWAISRSCEHCFSRIAIPTHGFAFNEHGLHRMRAADENIKILRTKIL